MTLNSDLEVTARCYKIRSTHVHSSQSTKAKQNLEDLLRSCARPSLLFSESSIAPLKHIARCHGLPSDYSEPLHLVLTDSKDNPKLALQLTLLLKYAQAKDPAFSKIRDLVKLLKNYPPQEVAANKEFFVLEIVTQLLLTVASSVDSAHIQNVRDELEDCKSYLPCVNTKFRTQIKGTFERMGFWTSSEGTYIDFNLKTGAARTGEEIIRSSHEKAASKVSAHVVKTQETQAITTEGNVSEKTQMQNINLSDALQQGREKSTSNRQQLSVGDANNKPGSDRSWWKTTSTEISNFLRSARGGNVVKDNDIIYLLAKFQGFKFSFSQSGRHLVAMIAEIFALISVYQELETSTVIQLLKEIMQSNRSNVHYDYARQDILKTTEHHCARLRENGHSFPEDIQQILSKFKEDESCTESMQRRIWRILTIDTGHPSINFEHTLELLRDPRQCLEALHYVDEIVGHDGNWTKLESLGLIPALVDIVVGSLKANKEAYRDPTLTLCIDLLWDILPGRVIYRNLKQDRTLNFSAVTKMMFTTMCWLDPDLATTSKLESHWYMVLDDRYETKFSENVSQAQNDDSTQVKIKALALLEEYLTLTGSQGLDKDVIVNLIDKSASEGPSSELMSPITRCVLHTLEKNAQNPPFFRHLPDSILAVLFATSCCSPDKRLQVFTLAVLSNLLNNAEINQWIVEGIRHVDFLRDKLMRRDVIYHSNGRVILEEELDEDFDFGENETGNEDRRDFSCLSAIVARIFIATLQSKRNICDESTISIAMRALIKSPDKMTRIHCAEYLFGAAKSGTKFTLPLLNDLRSFLFDTVADVRINVCAAYSTALANLTQVPLDHICYLPNVYSFKTVLIGDEDLTRWINEKILNVIRAGAEIHFFPDTVLHLLTLVLNGTCPDSQESEACSTIKLVLETIETYCKLPGRAETLPSVTIDAVENLLLGSDVFNEECALIISSCMMANHWVSDPFLEEFSKYLGYSPETSLPFLRRLCLANENQDLPIGIFENMQMELVGWRLWPQASPDGPEFLRMQKYEHANEQDLLRTLLEYLANGKLLSPFNVSVLEYLLRAIQKPAGELAVRAEDELNEIEELAVECLTMAGANGQGLPEALIELALSSRIPSPLSFHLAIAVVRQNQKLPQHFLQQVFQATEKGTKDPQNIQLVMNMILHNFQISSAVLRGYCQSILQVFDVDAITMDLLSSLVKLAEGPNAGGDPASLLKEAFLRAIETKDCSIARMGFKGLSLLDKELISSEDIQRISSKSQDPALRGALANFGGNSKEKLWLPPDPSQVPQNLFPEIQSLIEQSRLQGFKMEFPHSWMRELMHLVSKDSGAALLMKNMLDVGEAVHPIEIQIAEALCYGFLNATNDNIKTHCKGALSALIERGARIEDLSKYMSMSNQDEGRKWELEARGIEIQFLKSLRSWQLYPERKSAQASLSQHLQDQNVRRVYYKEIADTVKRVDKILWRDVPELVHSCAENLLRTGKVFGACAEVIEDHILLSTEVPSHTILAACMFAIKIGRFVNLLPVVEKCTKLLSPQAPSELRNVTLQLLIQVSCRQQLPPSTLDAIINCIISEDASTRGRSFAILLQQKKSCSAIGPWNEIYIEPLKKIYEAIFQTVDQDHAAKQDELNDELMLTVHSLKTCDLSRLKNRPREEWCKILMASDLIQTYGGSIENQIMMHPDAIEIAQYLSPSVWLDFLQDFDQLRSQNPQVSVVYLLELVVQALEAASHHELADIINSMGFKEDYLMDLITKALSKLLESCASGVSAAMATTIVHQLKSILHVGHIYKMFCVVGQAMKLEDVQDFVNFVEAYGPVSSDLGSVLNDIEDKQVMKLEDILKRMQLKTLMKNVPPVHAQYSNIESHVRSLLSSRFPYHHLHVLFKLIKSKSKSFLTRHEARLNALENILLQLTNYAACAEWFPLILESIRQCEDPHSWIHRINSLTMERIFSGSQGMKTLDDVWKELHELNPDMRSIFEDSMVHQVVKISKGDFNSSICPDLGRICCWKEREIQTWASAVKGTQVTDDAIDEALSISKRAFFLFKNYRLTDIQILAITSSLTKSHNRGLLLQVSTGSGKSTVIALIAVIQGLMGTQVDIYTSSPVLAERDAKEWTKFYAMFGLTCSHNVDKGSGYVRGKKACYKKDVVYGDTSQFQFDALRDEYSGLSTRAGRAYAYAIVDEVDSVLDDSSKLTRLSSTIPGMDLLQVIYHLTWNRLLDVQSRLFGTGPQIFYLEGRLEKRKDGVHSYHFVDGNGNLCTIDNLALFVLQAAPKDLEGAKIQILGEIEKFLANHLKDYIRVLIGDKTFREGDKTQAINLPKSVVNYARTQVNNWAESAMTALTFQENVHYVIDGGQIKPVDFLTTGIVQSSTNWNNGLHQFLQIKHAIKVTTETVTTNFLSNGAIFQKYAGNYVGFTGTLGSSYGRQVLKDVYRVEAVIIPELYFKRFLRYRDQICVNYAQWLSAIQHSALHETSKSRGVLIICQSIKFAEFIAGELRKSSPSPAQIKLYVRNGENQEKQVERIHPGDIIVATNLAGRGTDIKTVEVEKFGGLHVIVTFHPDSLRVEEQAFGRTSRQGNKGSGQLIVISSAQAGDLAVMRDQQERNQLKSYVQNQLKVINTKDKLFARFCTFYQEIREQLRENPVDHCVISRATSTGNRTFGGEALTTLEMIVLRSVEELWAIFLKRVDDGELALEEALGAYEDFEKELRQCNFAADSFFERSQNCFYWIQFGNEFYRLDGKTNEKRLEADKYFQRAIKEGAESGAGAYAGRAYTLLKGQVNAVCFNSHDVKYKEKSIKLLTSALKIVYTEISIHTTAQIVLQNRSADYVSSDLFNQLTSKIGMLGDYARNLGDVLSTVRKSLRAVECTGVSSYLQATSYLQDQMEVPFQDYSSYTLAFRDLTLHSDVSTVDQAVDTINRAMQVDKQVSIGLQFVNQNLKTLIEILSSEAKEGNLKLSRLGSCDIAAFGNISAKSFALEFGGTVAEIEKLPAILELKEFEVSFEDSSKAVPTIFKKTMTNEDSIQAALPSAVEQAQVIAPFHNFEELKASAHHLPQSCGLAITFIGTELKEIDDKWTILQNFNNNSIVISNLKPETAKKLIQNLRLKNLEFILRLENLSITSANDVLKHNEDRAQEEIMQHDLRNLSEQYSAEFLPMEEVRELAQRGIDIMPKFNELAFVPWRSVTAMGLVATVQVAAGAALVCTAFGASCGMAIITEGMSDYVTTGRAYSNRHFNWTGYAQQKAVSLTISAVTLGWGALKDGAKGASTFAGSALSEVTEQAGVMIVTQGRTMAETVKTSAQKLQSLVGRQIVLQGTETSSRVTLNAMVDSLVRFSFDQVRGDISAEINTIVDRQFRGKEFKEALAICSAIDVIGPKQFTAKLSRWVTTITNLQSAVWNKTWDTIGLPLCQGILSDPQYLGSTFSIATRIVSTITGMQQITTAVEKVCNEIYGNICNEKQSNSPAHLIQSFCSVTTSSANDIIAHMKFDEDQEFEVLEFPPQNILDEHMVKLTDLESLFGKLSNAKKNFKMENNCEMSKVIKSVVDVLTEHIIHMANRQMASPWTTMEVGSMVAGISREIQSRFLVSEANMSMDQERMLELKKRDPNSLNDEECAFLRAHDRRMTILDQITGVAKDHNLAYQKREMVAGILEMNIADSASQKKPSKQTRAAVESARNGGPADVSTVFILAKVNGNNIKVVDSADYTPTKEDREADVSIIVFEKSTTAWGLGHYSILDPNTCEMKLSSSDGKNFDCAYQVLSHITGNSVTQLRAQAADFIINNVEKYEQIQESAQWIRDRYPQDAHNILMLGGQDDEKRHNPLRSGDSNKSPLSDTRPFTSEMPTNCRDSWELVSDRAMFQIAGVLGVLMAILVVCKSIVNNVVSGVDYLRCQWDSLTSVLYSFDRRIVVAILISIAAILYSFSSMLDSFAAILGSITTILGILTVILIMLRYF